MLNKSIVLGMIFIAVFISPLAQAKAKESTSFEVKCFVDLIGGGQSIYFAYTNFEQFKRLPTSLLSKRVYTTDRDNKVKVYAVNECVRDKKKFKSKIANRLDESMTK